jgi:hypothetical protein
MAFLVCYSRSAPDDHGRQLAIYLDQQFYELLFSNCLKARSTYAVLGVVASLRYKSPLLVVADDELARLAQELTYLESAGHLHPQVAELREVCAKAQNEGYNLTISGDMYPEL